MGTIVISPLGDVTLLLLQVGQHKVPLSDNRYGVSFLPGLSFSVTNSITPFYSEMCLNIINHYVISALHHININSHYIIKYFTIESFLNALPFCRTILRTYLSSNSQCPITHCVSVPGVIALKKKEFI